MALVVQTAVGAQTVSFLTDNKDGTISVRLMSKDGADRTVMLREPTARDYAELRALMVETDDKLLAEFPAIDPPDIPDDATDAERLRIVNQYQRVVNERSQARKNRLRNIEDPPYVNVFVEVVRRLGDTEITLDDLPRAEPFESTALSALLEVWEGPLGGREEPDPSQTDALVEAVMQAVANQQNGESPPVSPEPEASSPPGTEPSTPPPLQSSTA